MRLVLGAIVLGGGVHVEAVGHVAGESWRPGLPAVLVEAPLARRSTQLDRAPLGGVEGQDPQLVHLHGLRADVDHLQPEGELALGLRAGQDVPGQLDVAGAIAEADDILGDAVGHGPVPQGDAPAAAFSAVDSLRRGPPEDGLSAVDELDGPLGGVEDESLADEDLAPLGHGPPPPDVGDGPVANASISLITSPSSSSAVSWQTMLVVL